MTFLSDHQDLVISITIASIFLLMLLAIGLIDNLALAGEHLANLVQARQLLEVANQELEVKIASASSLLTTEKKAKALGFHPITKLKWITN